MEEPSEGVKEATELALALLGSSISRDMEYEEWEFELEGGAGDGERYKVIVIKSL